MLYKMKNDNESLTGTQRCVEQHFKVMYESLDSAEGGVGCMELIR